MEVVKQQKALSRAISAINGGKVIICPTDTVYGFLADAASKKSVKKIFKLKKRPKLKPLPVFVKDLKMAKELAKIDEKQERIFKKYWPGKYTFVLERKHKIKLYGVDRNTIALRIPKYKFLNDLLKIINKPLVQTSVNISGEPAMIEISDIISQFKKLDILIIDAGDLQKNQPSQIIDLTEQILTRLR